MALVYVFSHVLFLSQSLALLCLIIDLFVVLNETLFKQIFGRFDTLFVNLFQFMLRGDFICINKHT